MATLYADQRVRSELWLASTSARAPIAFAWTRRRPSAGEAGKTAPGVANGGTRAAHASSINSSTVTPVTLTISRSVPRATSRLGWIGTVTIRPSECL